MTSLQIDFFVGISMTLQTLKIWESQLKVLIINITSWPVMMVWFLRFLNVNMQPVSIKKRKLLNIWEGTGQLSSKVEGHLIGPGNKFSIFIHQKAFCSKFQTFQHSLIFEFMAEDFITQVCWTLLVNLAML